VDCLLVIPLFNLLGSLVFSRLPGQVVSLVCVLLVIRRVCHLPSLRVDQLLFPLWCPAQFLLPTHLNVQVDGRPVHLLAFLSRSLRLCHHVYPRRYLLVCRAVCRLHVPVFTRPEYRQAHQAHIHHGFPVLNHQGNRQVSRHSDRRTRLVVNPA
jgi:hypothetical protein